MNNLVELKKGEMKSITGGNFWDNAAASFAGGALVTFGGALYVGYEFGSGFMDGLHDAW